MIKMEGKLPQLTEGEIFARQQQYERERLAKPTRRAALRALAHNPWNVEVPDAKKMMSNVRRVSGWLWEDVIAQLEGDTLNIQRDAEERRRRKG